MCLEVQWWSGLCRDIPSKVKEKFYVSHLTTKKRTDCLVKLLGVYRRHIPRCFDTCIDFDDKWTDAVMACEGHDDDVRYQVNLFGPEVQAEGVWARIWMGSRAGRG